MAGLFKNDPSFKGGKFLVLRRDGSIPEWPYMVLGARDPAAPAALRAYADAAELRGFDPKYVSDVRQMAFDFEHYERTAGPGDPDAPRHRVDCPAIIKLIELSKGA